MIGVHMHIGSQITTTEPYAGAAGKAVEIIAQLREMGHPIAWFNMGGGFGIGYRGHEAQPVAEFARAVVPAIKATGCRLAMEPGRVIAGNSGILVSRVLYTKQSGEKRFLIQDAAMNDLIRPALYESFHRIWPVDVPPGFPAPPADYEAAIEGTEPWDVVGPVCESGDFLAKDRALPPLDRGALLAMFSAGAYGMVMASNYNTRPRAAEILVDGSKAILARRRETLDDLIEQERAALDRDRRVLGRMMTGRPTGAVTPLAFEPGGRRNVEPIPNDPRPSAWPSRLAAAPFAAGPGGAALRPGPGAATPSPASRRPRWRPGRSSAT